MILGHIDSTDAEVDNQRLVLSLIIGLIDQYDSIVTLLQQSTPLPNFYTTHSRLCLEETKKSLQIATHAAITASSVTTTTPPSANVMTFGTQDRCDTIDMLHSH